MKTIDMILKNAFTYRLNDPKNYTDLYEEMIYVTMTLHIVKKNELYECFDPSIYHSVVDANKKELN
jgi:hypothetical protein